MPRPAPLVPLLVLLPALAVAGREPVVVDGRFDDWKGVPSVLKDPVDARGAEIDVREVRVTHDDEWLFLSLETERAVNLHALQGTLALLLDADGNVATGREAGGMPGIDVMIEFSPEGPQGRPAPGARVLTPHADGRWATHSVYETGLVFGPSFAAPRMELALRRGAVADHELFRGDRVRGKLTARDAGGHVVDDTAAFVHHFVPALAAPPQPRPDPSRDPLARPPGTNLRVLSWNVNRTGFVRNPAPFARILAAVKPDVLIFDELPPESSATHLAGFLQTAMAPPPEPFVMKEGGGDDGAEGCVVEVPCETPWNVVFGACGGRQRVAVAAKESLAPVGSLQWVDYPEQPVRELERSGKLGSKESADELLEQGVGTGGARLTKDGRTVLAASVDLQCCGGAAGPEDRLRVIEVSAIRDALRAALGAHRSDAVILAGDFNLVGSRVPLDLVSRNLDPDGDHLEVVDALQLDGRSNATWADPEVPFAPGRLDFMLYSESSLQLLHAFVFDAEDLGDAWRTRHGVLADDSRISSDHMPIVADFRWKNGVVTPASR